MTQASAETPRCPICFAQANAWCLEEHVAQAKDEVAMRRAALARDQAALEAFEAAGLARTGQLFDL